MAAKIAYSLCFLFFINLLNIPAQQRERDSLNKLYRTGADTTRVKVLNSISRLLDTNNPDSALIFGDSALLLARKAGYEIGAGRSYISIGSAYTTKSKYDLAIKNLMEGLRIFEKLKIKRAITNAYNAIANAYIGLKNNKRAYEFFCKAYQLADQTPGNEFMVAVASVGLGGVLMEEKKFNEAIIYFEKAGNYFRETNNLNYEAVTTSMIGESYCRAGNCQASERYYRKAIPVFRRCNNDYGLAGTLGSLGELEIQRKNYEQAAVYLREALTLNLQRKAWDNIQSTALKLSEDMEHLKNHAKALEYYKIYMRYKDSVINTKRDKAVADAELKYESEKKGQELKLRNIELKTSRIQVSQRNMLIYVFAGAILLFMILLFFVFKQNNEKKKANLMLTNKNAEIEKQKSIIQEKNKDITDSINYSRHIQQAIVPSPEKLEEAFAGAMVIFKPKDIVSGDFYVLEKNQDCIYLAVADCTGHGVPGAMLSVFAHSCLKNIIMPGNYKTDPAGILTELCRQFKSSLHANSDSLSINDGADIAICVIHPAHKLLFFAGAKNNLYRVRNRQIEDFAADRYGISGANSLSQIKFTNHQLSFEKNDKYYLFTDGFADQFGGPEGKKFKKTRLELLLLGMSYKPFKEQAYLLDSEFETWKGDIEQLDDVTIIGFEI